jgi:hypothetical protein
MLRLEFRWYVWVITLLIVFMIWKGPSVMAWVGGGILHGFADVGTDLVKGLANVKKCGFPCKATR